MCFDNNRFYREASRRQVNLILCWFEGCDINQKPLPHQPAYFCFAARKAARMCLWCLGAISTDKAEPALRRQRLGL